MREIKFRAWVKEYGNMRNVNGLNFCLGGITVDTNCNIDNSWAYKNKKYKKWEKWKREDTGIVLMQYTGLKDKNDKEIYENDIILYDGWPPKELIFDLDLYRFILKNTLLWLSSYECKTMEVIGNIYENPKLLGDNK